MTQRSGRWIPPQGLIFGQLAHGVSWIVLFVLAVRGTNSGGLIALGWLHLVALGFITTIALSVLFHVIPEFTDAVWRGERIARVSLAVYALGVILLVAAFCSNTVQLLPWAGAVVAFGLAGYAVPAFITLASALRAERVEAAIARALTGMLTFLLLAAALGVVFTWALNGRISSTVLVAAPVHAALGLIGWLTLLAMGVSSRTIRPLSGGRSRAPWRHIAATSCVVTAVIVMSAGNVLRVPPLLVAGVALLGCGLFLYIADMGLVLARATAPHRPPQAFLAAAMVWLAIAFVLSVGVLFGLPWGAACVYVALIGWIGQIVNAHLHHIGVRLLSTIFRGDDDETPPIELLDSRLSWTAFALFQIAVSAGLVAELLGIPTLLAAGAIAGFAAWIAMLANTIGAARLARRPPALISLLLTH